MKKSKNFLLMFLIGYVSYCLVYIARLNLSVASTDLGHIITDAQYGYIGSAFLIAFSCGRLLNGFIGDKVHPRYMLYIGLTLSGLANLGLSFLPSFPIFIALWSVNGYAQSMLWGSLLSYISFISPEDKRVTSVSVLVSSVAVGSVLGLLIATFATTAFGVSAAFLVPAILSITLAFLPLTMFNEKMEIAKTEKKSHIPMSKILRIPSVYIMLLPAVMHGVIKDNISSWAPKFFQSNYNFSLSQMQMFLYIIPVVGMVGRLIYPYFYGVFKKKENYVSITAAALCVASMLPLVLGVNNIIVAAVCLCLTNAAINVINTSMLSMFPLRFSASGNVSSVTGIMDFATYMGAGIGSAFYGATLKNGDFSIMFGSWLLIAVAISALLFLIIRIPKFHKD
jgi:OPA family glycerol-3-phosphate transporter-like MFS transporter